MLVRTFACAVTGIDAVTVTIEVNVSRGIQFFLVGLPDSAVREIHQIPVVWKNNQKDYAMKIQTNKKIKSLLIDGCIFMDAYETNNTWASK